MLITAKEIIRQSCLLYKNHWRQFLPFLILLLAPQIIVSIVSTVSLYLSVLIPSIALANKIIVLAVIAANLVFTLWVSIGFYKTIVNCMEDKKSAIWKEAFTASASLIWPIILVYILTFLIVLGGAILLIIPGIIFSIWYLFSVYAVIFENKKGMEALKASKQLVVGRWWAIVWRLIIPATIFGLPVAIIANLITKGITAAIASQLYQLFSATILIALIEVIVSPLSAGALLILY